MQSDISDQDDERDLSPAEVQAEARALYESNLAWVQRRDAARRRAEVMRAEAAQREAERHIEGRADLNGDVWRLESLHAGAAAQKAGREALARMRRAIERARQRDERKAAKRAAKEAQRRVRHEHFPIPGIHVRLADAQA